MIIFKSLEITPPVEVPRRQSTDWSELREKIATGELNAPVKEIQSINKDSMIKPNYIEDKSVAYKSSGYVRDLLGEGK